jgi:hypothetical protein
LHCPFRQCVDHAGTDGFVELWIVRLIERLLAPSRAIDVEWRSVCVGDMRDAYDLLTRKLARDGTAQVQAKSIVITMALDGNISELQQLLPDGAPERVVAERLQMIVTAISHLRE